jgi:predicted ester cyclase
VSPTPDELKQKMVRLYDESNRMNLDVFDEMFAPEFVSYGGAGFKDLHGPKEFKDLYLTFLAAMPDLRFDPTFMVAEGDIVFVRGTLGGTHKGNFMGMAPATNRYIRWTGTAIFRCNDQGMFTARWQEWDGMSVMQQMGVIPTPDGQPAAPAPAPDLSHVLAGPSSPEAVQANRKLMEQFIEQVWNRKNLAFSAEVFAPDATSPDAPTLPPGPAGVNAIAQTFFTAFPDFHMTIDFLAAEGDRVAAHFVQGGTHRGELFGIKPTGNTVSFGEMGLLRIENGKVVESFYNTDMLTLMQQLGVGAAVASGA